jgi:hypothetical protein
MRVIQNCFAADQVAACTFEPYLNVPPRNADERYLFLESNVIRTLVEARWHVNCEYFGVLGHRWYAKLDEAKAWSLPIRNLSEETVTAGALDVFADGNPDADFLSLGHFVPHHVFECADRIHPGLQLATERILASIGVRARLARCFAAPIYYNSFLAKPKAVEGYVSSVLGPAIHAATHDPDLRPLLFRDAGYFRPFPKSLARVYGINHYPLHPFIGERLVNVYVDLSGARVAQFRGVGNTGLRKRVRAAVRPLACTVLWTLQRWRRSFGQPADR